MFDQFEHIIRTRYPQLTIVGDNFPPPPLRLYACQFLGMLKFALIFLLIIGNNPFSAMNLPTPSIYSWALANKIYACMMLFFLSNAIEGQLISTGAFEINLNDVPVWSKMRTGRLPSADEMFQILDNHMRLAKDNTGI